MKKSNDHGDEEAANGDDTGRSVDQLLDQNLQHNPPSRLDGTLPASSTTSSPSFFQEVVKHKKDDGNKPKRVDDAACDEDDDDDETTTKKKIDKAIKFWRHPILQNVSMDEKRAYLHNRGITDEILHKAWDKMMEMDSVVATDGVPAASATNTKNNVDLITRPPQGGRSDGTGRGDRNTTPSNGIGHTNGGSASLQGSTMRRQQPYGPPQHHQHAGVGAGGYPYHDAPYPSYNSQTVHNGGGYDYDDRSENGQIIPVAHGLSLLAVGGMIGLTAAAAVRWLNGGEFEIFPPMTVEAEQQEQEQQEQEQQQEQQQQQLHRPQQDDYTNVADLDEQDSRSPFETRVRNDNFDDDDGDGDDDDEQQIDDYEDDDDVALLHEELIGRIEELTEKVQHNTSIQESILKKVSISSSAFADQSMNLLRRASDVSASDWGGGETKSRNETGSLLSSLDVSSLLSELNQIKEDLSQLSDNVLPYTNNDENETIQQKSTSVLSALDSCIEKVQNAAPGTDLTKGDSPTISATSPETVSTEGEEGSLSSPRLDPTSSTLDFNGLKDNVSVAVDTSTGNRRLMTLHECIKLIAENDMVTTRVGCQLLYMYLVNLAGHPDSPRYRTIYTSNDSFQKVATLSGGRDLLEAVGFQDDESRGTLEWIPSAIGQDEVLALVNVREAAAALSVLKSGKPSAETTTLALSKLSPEIVENEGRETTSVGGGHLKLDQSDNNHDTTAAPQTPIGTSLVSPPVPKRMHGTPPSGTPTNLAERMENSQEDP